LSNTTQRWYNNL